MGVFLGAPVLAALAAVLRLSPGHRKALPWTAAGFVLAVAALIITIVVHVPLTTAINTAGDPDQITDLAGLRVRGDLGALERRQGHCVHRRVRLPHLGCGARWADPPNRMNPRRVAYSHSASVGSRLPAHAAYASASFHDPFFAL
jgi:hypothetical protein